MKYILLIITFICSLHTLMGQKKGDQLYENLGYLAAADYYQDLEAQKQTFEIKLKLANSFRLNSQYESAEYWYAQIIREAKEKETLLHYAQVLQANGKCEDAIRWFEEYAKQGVEKNISFIENCEEIDKFEKHKNIKLKNLSGINTEHHDFSPIPYQNGIIFTSMRTDGKKTKQYTDIWTQDNYSDLFLATKDGEKFKDIKALKGAANDYFHDGTATFDLTNKKMYFTRTSKKKSSEGQVKQLTILSAKKTGDSWEELDKLSFCSKEFSYCHPTLSADGQRLYFASDCPGGFGGMDIYVSQKLGNKWGEPVNLGPIVNTAGNEIFPFISQKDKLFFASEGHKGIGGLDVFVVEKTEEANENAWSNRKNIGKPFNSKKDDFGFYINAEETSGYISSNRPGGAGQDDIYAWEKTEEVEEDPFDPSPKNSEESIGSPSLLSIAVCDAKTGVLLPAARVALLKSEDNWIAYEDPTQMPNSILTNNLGGDFGIKVQGGVVRADASFTTNEEGYFNYYIKPEQVYSFYAEKDYYRPNRQQLIGAQLIENKDYCIPLLKRECVKLKGAVKNKKFPKFISDAEITLIDKCTGKISTLYTDFEGKFEACIECNCEYEIIARKVNFKEGKTTVSTLNVPCNTSILLNTLIELELDQFDPNSGKITPGYLNEYLTGDPDGNYTVGQEITLRNIYYDFDKYDIRPDAANDLDYLALVMKEYPSMEISLASHTDSRGKSKYNDWLSRRRSLSAKNYLIKEGVAANRIQKTIGLGESQLVNDCHDGVDCSESAHQLNRRTVVTITRIDDNVKIKTISKPSY